LFKQDRRGLLLLAAPKHPPTKAAGIRETYAIERTPDA
jgi:hypothetical protein